MRVYCDDSGEVMDVDALGAAEAAEIVHGQIDDGSGNAGTYRVESKPGEWERYTVRTEYTPVHTTRSKGPCDAPEIEEE